MHFYTLSGLTVASDVVLPGALACEHAAVADVTVCAGPVPTTLAEPTYSGPIWQIAGKEVLLTVPNVARFWLKDGREIAFEADAAADEADVTAFIVGSVFGILLHQRKYIALHASAVRVNDKAILFCGASGAGKSTLAAALGQRGYPLLSDDICALSVPANGTPMAYPDGRQLKLWAHSIDRLSLAERRAGRLRRTLEKFYVEPPEATSAPLPVGAVYMLREARPPHTPRIERPNVVDATVLLRRNAYRPLLVIRMEQRADYFRAAAALADTAGIFHLTRAFDFARMPDTLGMLERHWLDLGLLEKAA